MTKQHVIAAFVLALAFTASAFASGPASLSNGFLLPGGDRQTSPPTVQNAAYSSGNCVGGFNSVTFQGTGPISLLNDVSVISQGGGTETLTVYVFDQNPSGSTCTDKSTFTLATADTAKLLMSPFALTLVAPTGATQSFASNPNLARIPKSGTTTLWYALVAGGSFTPGSTTDLIVGFQVTQQHQ